jgi:small neutral amino acid transporter SnatA (MarC family)
MPAALFNLVAERLKTAGRHAALKAALYAGAALLIILAIAFLGLAAFAALAQVLNPAVAALIVAGGFVVIAIVLIAVASIKPRQRETSTGDMMTTAMAAMPAVTSPLRNVRRKPVQSLLMAVAAGAMVAALSRNRSRDGQF